MSNATPGFYVVARSGKQRAELVGPFRRRLDAESEVEVVAEAMLERYPEYSGNVTFAAEEGEPSSHGRRKGTKVRLLGYRTDLNGWVV